MLLLLAGVVALVLLPAPVEGAALLLDAESELMVSIGWRIGK
jgi:hypothetical protein